MFASCFGVSEQGETMQSDYYYFFKIEIAVSGRGFGMMKTEPTFKFLNRCITNIYIYIFLISRDG